MMKSVVTTLLALIILFSPLSLKAQVIGDQPSQTIRDTHAGATLINGGLWRWHLVNGQMILEMNTASNGGFGTTVQYIALTGSAIDIIQPFTDTTHANVSATYHGLVPKAPANANQFLNGTAGAWVQPSCSNLSGVATSCSTDTTNAANISSGTLGTARMGSGTANSSSLLRGDNTWGKAPLAGGGTNTDLSATGGASQVLKQVTSGAGITVARLACADLSDSSSGCSSAISTEVRLVWIDVPQILNTGSPVTIQVGTGAIATQFPNGADSSVVISRFLIPPDATASQSILLTFGYNADSAPGATNNKFTFKVACTRNGSAVAYTATDTITASNDTSPHTFSGTNTTCGSVSAGDLLSVVLYRVTGGANDAAVPIDVTPIGFKYTSVQ